MENEKHREFIKRSYEEYKKLGYVECLAFDNEKIYFHKKGFRHLLYKQNDRRHDFQQKRRLNLIRFTPIIIKATQRYTESRKIISSKDTIYFWSLEGVFENRTITVIIRQINNGPKNFFSVMSKKVNKNAKAP